MGRAGPPSRRLSIPLPLILALATVISMWPAAAVATPAARVTSIGVKTYPGVVQVAIGGARPPPLRRTAMSNSFPLNLDCPGGVVAGAGPRRAERGAAARAAGARRAVPAEHGARGHRPLGADRLPGQCGHPLGAHRAAGGAADSG